jgi:CheY-like chemotaxis protein
LIFEQFSEEDNTTTNAYGSTGLGLTIAKKLAMLMGGNIKADSVIGQGTEVVTTVVLPLAQSESNAEEAIHDSHDISPKVILAVDDIPLNLTVISLLLEKDGHEVHIACNGAEALEKVINSAPYDAILMDYHMPVMDGVEATKAIRKLDDLIKKVTPIFGFTADIEVESQQKLMNAGMNGILNKPLDRFKLRKKLATMG